MANIHDIEHRRPHVWLARAIEHLSWDTEDDATMAAISLLASALRQVRP